MDLTTKKSSDQAQLDFYSYAYRVHGTCLPDGSRRNSTQTIRYMMESLATTMDTIRCATLVNPIGTARANCSSTWTFGHLATVDQTVFLQF